MDLISMWVAQTQMTIQCIGGSLLHMKDVSGWEN